jgi:2'-hydroxyisoflavone reductase
MQLLMLGGSVFLGAALVDAALARGHAVTVFNRGRARADWPVGVEALTGDRSGDLGVLAGRRWDAVLDTSGQLPRDARASAEALRDSGRYLFVSSVSAYASFARAPVSEADALASAAGIDPADRDPSHYGAQKAACERAVQDVFGARAAIVRPGLIMGPRDPTGRFSYWPWRVAAGGAMLVPDVPAGQPLQCIDVRDLADWMLHLVEQDIAGVFNATGPVDAQEPLDWPALLDACASEVRARGGEPARPVRVGEAFLAAHGVEPWSALPLWIPSSDPEHAAFMRVDVARARAAGLRTRPLRETIAAVLDEAAPVAGDRRRSGKLGTEREARLLADWADRPASDRSAHP